MLGRVAAAWQHAGRLLMLVTSLVFCQTGSAGVPYPFPAPSVQCRSDLAWLRLAMPEVLISLQPEPVGRDGVAFTPSRRSVPEVWQRLQQDRYCELARTLRHRVA
ncbi:hypothetical protein GYRE_00756 [Yokenella regensburgei ATCC 49455]|uniref:Uncharacterized protein n=2 Tax=Yokenella regensburgei TaxID=158877 RepID=A0AB38FXX3_9ENTR|nr:hypothetical protein GYRE_00756 [Yokenella regensburgei ATCC 49455]SQA62997.1 Uncharacterised protein [Yokenella regensburgei]SQB02241.1 Uncharacterised protein [Yokenella regensburgei]SUQ07459.1 Uncharacterised protein [Yokenella regensburgei]